MLFVGVDLAERHSAAVAVDENDIPVAETFLDSGKSSDNEFDAIRPLIGWWAGFYAGLPTDQEIIICVEKTYFHARNAAQAERVFGALLAVIVLQDLPDCHTITPLTWQKPLGYVKKEWPSTKHWAKALCEDLAYEPGELIEGKVLAKPKEDLRDARLIAHWLRDQVLGV